MLHRLGRQENVPLSPMHLVSPAFLNLGYTGKSSRDFGKYTHWSLMSLISVQLGMRSYKTLLVSLLVENQYISRTPQKTGCWIPGSIAWELVLFSGSRSRSRRRHREMGQNKEKDEKQTNRSGLPHGEVMSSSSRPLFLQ